MPLYFRSQFIHNRGFAQHLLRVMADTLGVRERVILEDPQVHVRRWPDSSDCVEFCVIDRPELGTCVIRRDLKIVN
jgi:hypothetical protein